ncbi:Two-component response regulator ARR2 [Linum perenne]
MNSPSKALKVLQKKHFDLVITSIHMHEMDGKRFFKKVTQEIRLPVVVMSADSDERMMLQTLEDGAAMYLVKPINKDDLKNVLQYAYSTTNEAKFTNDDDQESESDDAKSASSVNNFNTKSQPKAIAKRGRKRAKKHDKGEDECESRRAKKKNKTKVVWTSSLHNQFLDAVNFYGQEKAVPKRILEFMHVPGLTRENIASHLQVKARGLTSSNTKSMSSNLNFDPSSIYKEMRHEDLELLRRGRRRNPIFQQPNKPSNPNPSKYHNLYQKYISTSTFENRGTSFQEGYNNCYKRVSNFNLDGNNHNSGTSHDVTRASNPSFSTSHGVTRASNPSFSTSHAVTKAGNPSFSTSHGVTRASNPSFNRSSGPILSNHMRDRNLGLRNSVNVTPTLSGSMLFGSSSSMQLPSFPTSSLPNLSVNHNYGSVNSRLLSPSFLQLSITRNSGGKINSSSSMSVMGSNSTSIINDDVNRSDNLFNDQEFDSMLMNDILLQDNVVPPSNQLGVELNNYMSELSQPNLSNELLVTSNKLNEQDIRDTMMEFDLFCNDSSRKEVVSATEDQEWADGLLDSLLGNGWENS